MRPSRVVLLVDANEARRNVMICVLGVHGFRVIDARPEEVTAHPHLIPDADVVLLRNCGYSVRSAIRSNLPEIAICDIAANDEPSIGYLVEKLKHLCIKRPGPKTATAFSKLVSA